MIERNRLFFGAVLAVLLASGAAMADEAAEGRRLAEQWCAACHAVAPGGAGVEPAPPFEAIVGERGRSDDWIATWLSTPHEMMPDLTLTRAEISALVAYFNTLRPGE